MKLLGFKFILFIPIFMFFCMVLFFLIYQISIGNPFLEEVHPVLVLVVFLVFIGVSSYTISTYRVVVNDRKIFIRDGFKVKVFSFEDIIGFFKHERGDKNFFEGREVFDFGGSQAFEFRLRCGDIVVLYFGDSKFFDRIVDFLKKS